MNSRLNSSWPVVFLDYDGVLHPAEVYWYRGQMVSMRHGMSLFEWAPMLVRALAPHPKAQLVLSTTWVRMLGFEAARKRLPHQLQARVVGSTWQAHRSGEWEHLSRYEQIMQYVRRHNCRRWVAVDDDIENWGGEHRDRLVATDSEFGLGDVEKLQELRQKLACFHGE